jgi:hypothetical protein
MVLAMVFLAIGHPLFTFDKLGVRHDMGDSLPLAEKNNSASQIA